MRTPRASRDAGWLDELLPVAGTLVVGLATVEFLLLRLLNRVSGTFPVWMRGEAAQDIVLAGTFAYNGAFLLSAFLVLAVGWRLAPKEPAIAGPLLAWVPALLAAQVLGRSDPAAILLAGLVALACLLAPIGRHLARRPGRWRVRSPSGHVFVGSGLAFSLFLLAAAGTFLAAMYFQLGNVLANLAVGPPGRPEVYAAGEGLGLTTAVLAAAAFPGRPNRWNVGIPAVAGILVGAWFLVRPELPPLVAYWSIGFQVSLPVPLYLAALVALLYALANAWSMSMRPRTLGYGLLLLALAGRQLADLYLVQLAIVSLMFLAMPEAVPHAADLVGVSADREAAHPEVHVPGESDTP